MKTKWNAGFLQGLEELDVEAQISITGGETFWYWVGLVVGLPFYMVTHATPDQSAGQKLMNAALG
jgi:hypothetical protein